MDVEAVPRGMVLCVELQDLPIWFLQGGGQEIADVAEFEYYVLVQHPPLRCGFEFVVVPGSRHDVKFALYSWMSLCAGFRACALVVRFLAHGLVV